MDNAWFRALVWFLDVIVSIPSRKVWQSQHLSSAVEKAQRKVMKELEGVMGVSLMFDLWISRNGMCYCVLTLFYCVLYHDACCVLTCVVYVSGEDVLSLDIAFIDRSWNYIMRNIGLIHCKEGTSGAEVARAIRLALEKNNLIHRIYAYVKDQGSNLKSTTMALSNIVEM